MDESRGSTSPWTRARVAQTIEQCSEVARVGGLTPSPGTILLGNEVMGKNILLFIGGAGALMIALDLLFIHNQDILGLATLVALNALLGLWFMELNK